MSEPVPFSGLPAGVGDAQTQELYAEVCRLRRVVRLAEACGIVINLEAGCVCWRGCLHYPKRLDDSGEDR